MIATLSEHLPEAQKQVLVLNKADAVRCQDRPKLEALGERLLGLHAFDRWAFRIGWRRLRLLSFRDPFENHSIRMSLLHLLARSCRLCVF